DTFSYRKIWMYLLYLRGISFQHEIKIGMVCVRFILDTQYEVPYSPAPKKRILITITCKR
ncbi:hypothetical protein ACFL9U_18110, partial [Thermodesulfobacteriota bacterium]